MTGRGWAGLRCGLVAVGMLCAGVASAQVVAVGPVSPAHGFPLWYEDSNGLRLDLCLDNNGLCLATLPNPAAPPSIPNNFPDEAFWWSAEATMPTNGGGQALLVLALEAAWLNETPAVGEQIVFGRIRVRVDNLVAGQSYRVIHPFGESTFVAQAAGRRGINVTQDIGCLSVPCDFTLAMSSPVGPFLRWDPAVLPAAPAGYIGDPAILHTVIGSPTGNNFFRIEGLNVGGPGVNAIQTNLFAVQGKISAAPPPVGELALSTTVLDFGSVLTGGATASRNLTVTNVGGGPLTVSTLTLAGAFAADYVITADTCSGTAIPAAGTCSVTVQFTPANVGPRPAELQILADDQATPRLVALRGRGQDPLAPTGDVGPVNVDHGFPDWYEDLNGVRLALCLDNNGLCLGTLPNPAAPPSIPANFPDEAFWWAGEANIAPANGVDARLVLAMEAAWFNEVPEVGQQMSFGRVRVRIDGLTAGRTYTVTHPFGVERHVADAAGVINVTEDIGCGNAPCDFRAALDSRITHFLRWDPTVAPLPPAGYIGDPNVLHAVIGSPTGNNFFRVEGPNVGGPGVNLIETNLFAIQGKLATPGVEQLALSPSPVDFGNVVPGAAAAPRTFVIQSAGTGPVTLGTLSLAGINCGDFTAVHACDGATLASGETCTVEVGFTAAALGVRSCVLVIPGNAEGNPHSVVLTGTGTDNVAQPQLSVPATLAFGNVNVGSVADQTLTVTNTGGAALNVGTPAITGANAGDFTVNANTCTAPVAPAGTCTLTVRFAPTAGGARAAALSLPSNDPAGARTVSLGGTGVLLAPQLSVPATLAFGNVNVGASADLTLTVSNTGAAPLTVGTPAITGANAADFAVVGNACTAPVAAGGTCALTLRFTPSAAGARAGTLTLPSNDPAGPRTVALSGTGVALQPVLGVPATLAFGNVNLGANTVQTLTVTNTGAGALNVGTPALTGAQAGDFSLVTNGCTAPVAAGGTCALTLRFTPAAAGARAATLTLPSNDPAGPRTVALSGTGVAVAAGPRLTFEPDPLDFGNAVMGVIAQRVVTVRNTGTANLLLGGAFLNGPNNADWAVLANNCGGRNLAPNGTCTITIGFRPTALGLRVTTLSVNSTDPANPRLLAIRGTGVTVGGGGTTAPALTTDANVAFGPVGVGVIASRNFVLRNTGTAALSVGALTLAGANAGDFRVSTNPCSGTQIAPGGTCTVVLTFQPAVGGSRSATLSIVHNATGSPRVIPLTGEGQQGGTLTATPSPLAFGRVSLGSLARRNVTLTNTGGGTLTFDGAPIVGTHALDFDITRVTCGPTLAPGASCQVEITFRPRAAGNRSATLRVQSNAVGNPTLVPMTGTGG